MGGRRATIAFEAVCLSLLVTGGALAISLSAGRSTFLSGSVGPFPGAFLHLLWVVILVSGFSGIRGLRVPVRKAVPTVIAGAVLFASAALMLGTYDRGLGRVAGIIFVLAAAEEAVFRRMLPDRLIRMARGGWGERSPVAELGPHLLAQIAFASSHYPVVSQVASFGFPEWFRLVSAGMLYSLLARRWGLWVAIGVHASLNFHLLYGVGFAYRSPPPGEVLIAAFCAALLLAVRPPRTSAPPQPVR
jgi:hypothetical protein